MNRQTEIRSLLQPKSPLLCMGAYDPFSARLVEQAGYDVIYLGGFAAAASMLGLPDLGLLTMPEMTDHIARVAAVTTRPIIADADNGHGGALNVARTVATFQRAGAAGLHMEDQVMPKKCGHLGGKAVIPVQDMVQKLRAAQDARDNSSFFIIARTDAIAVEGIDAAIERAKRYADAGADALFLDAPESMSHLEKIVRELTGTDKPLVFNAASTGKTPALSVSTSHGMGFGIILYPIETLLAAMNGIQAVLSTIRTEGDLASIRHQMSSFDEIRDALGFSEAESFEEDHPVGR